MTRLMRRIRGAIGMGLAWAIVWSSAGVLVSLGFVLRTGHRPDAPFPIMFAGAGFIAGILFSAMLSLVDGRRSLDQLSRKRVAAWGASGAFLLATTFVSAVALSGDPAFLWNLLALGPLFAAAGAGSAAASLTLARRTQDRMLLDTNDEMSARQLVE